MYISFNDDDIHVILYDTVNPMISSMDKYNYMSW